MSDPPSSSNGDSSQQSNSDPRNVDPGSDTPKLKFWDGSSSHINQGRHWSSAIIWLSTSLFGITLLWAFTAKIDQSVSVPGRLQPSGSVRNVESPSGGVIDKVFVEDGDFVSAGTALFTVEGKGLLSRKNALHDTQQLLQLQAESLKAVLISNGDPLLFGQEPSVPDVSNPVLQSQLTARQQSQQLRSQLIQLSSRLSSRVKTLSLKQRIVSDLTQLYENELWVVTNIFLN